MRPRAPRRFRNPCPAPGRGRRVPFGVKAKSRFSPQRETSTLPLSSAPWGTSGAGGWGWSRAGQSTSRRLRARAASRSGIACLIVATSALSASARSLVALAHRLADQLGGLVAAALRLLQLGSSPAAALVEREHLAATGSNPRVARAASKACGSSRIRRRSCMAAGAICHCAAGKRVAPGPRLAREPSDDYIAAIGTIRRREGPDLLEQTIARRRAGPASSTPSRPEPGSGPRPGWWRARC